ncbi:MAG TPA: aromatic ring-hydroxylating dioxygenase subunit alpha [Kofleriaceae bacterium]|nr:aromatic ring-hydroxylating dioxygenase subunit alpha [Kofleriaceae bacterium]
MQATQDHPALVDLARRLRARMESGRTTEEGSTVGAIDTGEYLSEERHRAEQERIFRVLPQIVAVTAELAAPGACLVREVGGVSILVMRGADGAVRGFRNACRHRATALVDAPCTLKAIVCPYHGWTYDTTGALIHVPHPEAFDASCRERTGLVEVPLAVRHGLVFAGLAPFDLDDFLAPLDGELAALGVEGWTVYRHVTREVGGNWKLIIDAFLDAYHLRQLHRTTIYPFFADAWAEMELAGRHMRAVVARRGLAEAGAAALAGAAFRSLVTPSYFLFPAAHFILHPDYLSILTCQPLAASRTRFQHWMLIPAPPETEAAEAHWAKSFDLIDGGVFAREDLRIVEAMQRGLAASGDRTVVFGRHEHGSLWFHRHVSELLPAP